MVIFFLPLLNVILLKGIAVSFPLHLFTNSPWLTVIQFIILCFAKAKVEDKLYMEFWTLIISWAGDK